MKGGVYYGLNPVGSRIWDLVKEPRRFKEINQILLEEYDVEPDQCAAEVRAFIREMHLKKLVQVINHEVS